MSYLFVRSSACLCVALLLAAGCAGPTATPVLPKESTHFVGNAIPSDLSAKLQSIGSPDAPQVNAGLASAGLKRPQPRFDSHHLPSDALGALKRHGFKASDPDSVARIHVVFDDEAKVRHIRALKQGLPPGGEFRASTRFADQMESLNGLLASLGHRASVEDAFVLTKDMSEAEMDREQEIQEGHTGADIPHRASMYDLNLLGASEAEVIRTLETLNRLPVVKGTQVAEPASPGSPHYVQPPSDNYYPTGSGWESRDYNNPKTMAWADQPPGANAETWWFNHHSIGKAWELVGKGNTGTKVAVVDTGFETAHWDAPSYDLVNKRGFWKVLGVRFENDDVSWQNSNGYPISHGTLVSHFVASKDSNSMGVSGVAPGVSVLPIKVTADTIADGIDYARGKGVSIVNVSWWGNGWADPNLEGDFWIRWAMSNAHSAGILVVYCAGNSDQTSNWRSDWYTGALSVSGINKAHQGVYVRGSRVDITAASQQITQTGIGGAPFGGTNGDQITIANVNGTSFAAPIVTGAAALIKSAANLTPDAIKSILIFSSDYGREVVGGGHQGANLDQSNNQNFVAKVRVLNAAAAASIVTGGEGQIHLRLYVSNVDDTAYVYYNNPVWGWMAEWWVPFLQNGTAIYSAGGYSSNRYVYSYNEGGPWTLSAASFDSNGMRNWRLSGVSSTRAADGYFIQWGVEGDPNIDVGWHAGWEFSPI